MSKLRVLLDTNVIVSGLVFIQGNEHRVLRIAEKKQIILVLPEFVLQEARSVFAERFAGHEVLLDSFLSRTDYTVVPWSDIEPLIPSHKAKVRDWKDAPILVSVLLAKPDCAVTGDRTLREDLQRFSAAGIIAKILSPKQFLDFFASSQQA